MSTTQDAPSRIGRTVRTRHGTLAITVYAQEQYRSRIDRSATDAEIAAAFGAAELRRGSMPPGRIQLRSQAAYGCAGWLVAPNWACPVVLSDGRYVATTCIARMRRPKADRRQYRAQLAEDAA